MRSLKGGNAAAAVIALGAFLVAAAGCGPPADASDRPEEVPRPPGTLRLFTEAPSSLDPLDSDSVYEGLPVNQIFDGLVSTDRSLHVAPGLAESWTISRDGRVYRFRLRENARFADGTPVTAGDVVFTFERALSPLRGRRPMVTGYLEMVEGARSFSAGGSPTISGVKALDPRTVEIRLSRPYVSFLGVLALDNLRIVPRHVLERIGGGAFARNPTGSGPYRLERWTDSGMVLVTNPEHWGAPPRIPRVEIGFPASGDPGRAASLMADGALDLLEPSPEDLARLMQRNDLVVYRYQELAGSFLGLSTGHPPLDDPRIRQAIAHAIDREAIASLSPTTRRLAEGILPPGMPGYSPSPKALSHDPQRARELLEEAGHPGGRGLKPVRLFAVEGSDVTARTADRVRHDLAAVGIPMVIERVSWAEMASRIDDNAAPAFLLGWIADLVDPDGFLRTLFEPEGSSNFFAFHNERIGRILDQATQEMNPVERARLYRSLEVEILREAPVVPLFLPRGVVVHRRGVHGVEPGPLGVAALDLEKAWIEADGGQAQ